MGKLSKDLEKKLHGINIAPIIVEVKRNPYKVYRDYYQYDASISIRPFRLKIMNDIFMRSIAPIGYYGVIEKFNMFTGLFDRYTIEDMENDPRIKKVYLDKLMWIKSTVPEQGIYTIRGRDFTTTYWTKRLIGGDKANEKGYTGRGVKVGVIDTGVQVYHKQLGRRWGRIEFYSVMPVQRIDENGHGSWCCTCIGGTIEIDEVASNIVGRKVLVEGIAPECDIIAIKALGYVVGLGTTSQILKALELAVNKQVDVINMSLGGPVTVDKPEDDPYYTAMQKVVDNDIIPVVAAGNEGPEPKTISSPGAMPQVLTVGAWDPIKGVVADFSSRGPTPWEDIKPDVIAPGVNIDSGLTGILDYVFDKLPSRFSPLSGTSMATPHVAGLTTLMRQAHADKLGKTLTVNEVKRMMEEWAKTQGMEKSTDMGWGLITWDIYEWWLETEYSIKI